ncbi:MAG: hypothetical protein EOO07_22445 [Chitinophagaceae bacterium]|nr:MAG: hypothetical protein EOO07_22445 [Chitinophagaceae bacterium]
MTTFKKLVPFFLFVLGFSATYAQQTRLAFEKGESTIQVGFGLGITYADGAVNVPPLQVRYEKAVTEYISVGGILGYSSSTYNFQGYDYNFNTGMTYETLFGIKQSYLLIGARANYHFETGEKFDPYGGATLGYSKISTGDNIGAGVNLKNNLVLYGAQIGANYYFSDKIGGWAELGYGISYFNLGLSYKF